MNGLLERGTLAGLAANDLGAEDDPLAGRRFEATLGYGLPAFGGRFTATPELGFGLSDSGRQYRLGWRLARASRAGILGSLEVLFESTRSEPANDDGAGAPEHAVGVTLTARW